MNASDDERLMRYVDGELSPAEASEIEAWLARSEEARTLVASLEAVSDAVESIGRDMSDGSDGIADAVMARIDEVAGPVSHERTVAPEARPALAVVAPGKAGSIGRRWAGWTPAIGLGLAAAAAVALYLRPPHLPSGVRSDGSSAARVAPGPSPPQPGVDQGEQAGATTAEAEEPGLGASIESVDFGASAGSIFMVAGGTASNETETPVVWLMDEAGPDEGRMVPR